MSITIKNKLINRLSKGGFWSVFGAIIERFMTIIVTIYVVRKLGSELYGQFSIIQSTVSMFAVFASMGISVTATKFTANLKSIDKIKLGKLLKFLKNFNFITGVIVTILLFFLSNIISENIFKTPQISVFISIVSIALFFNTINGFYSGCLIGFEALKKNAIVYAFPAILSLPITIFLVNYYGLKGLVCALVITAFFRMSLSNYFFITEKKKIDLSLNYSEYADWSVIRTFAFPAFLSGLVLAPSHWICHSILMSSKNGANEMALIGVSMQWFYALMFIPIAANRILLPVLADNNITEGDKNTIEVMKYGLYSSAIFIVPVVLILIFLSSHVMLMYGEEYINNTDVLIYALLAGMFSVLSLPLGQLIASENKMWFGFLLNCIWAVIYIVVSFFSVGNGASGIASALTLAYFFHFLISFIYMIFRFKNND